MKLQTDDEIYRVNAVWLGPPRATFPWQARYVSYGIGAVVLGATLLIERRLGIGFGIWAFLWALLLTIAVTRLVGRRVDAERPLSHTVQSLRAEITTPREHTEHVGGQVDCSHIRIRPTRPTPTTGRRRSKGSTRS